MLGHIKDGITAAKDRDPAATSTLEIILCYPGFHAILTHRLAHYLHTVLKIPVLPRLISQTSRFFTGIEIHPGAKIGKGFFIDHGMGVVIGETSEIGDNCTLFQGVTLGGTGKERGKRHPTLGNNVVIGAGASILGDITIGDSSYIGAGSVVTKEVPPNCTMVGVPARIVRFEGKRVRGATLAHPNLPAPMLERLQQLQEEIERAERMLRSDAAEREER